MPIVTAARFFYHKDMPYRIGDAVEMEPLEAVVAARRGDVVLYPPKSPTYRRRDMVAESMTMAEALDRGYNVLATPKDTPPDTVVEPVDLEFTPIAEYRATIKPRRGRPRKVKS